MKVLLAEDNPEIQFTLQAVLEGVGHQCFIASSGQEALQYLEAQAKGNDLPDIILSDISMPGMGGFDMLRKIRENAQFSSIPFVFLSSRSEIEDIREGLQLGADDYLFKPFQAQELLLRLESLCPSRGKKNQLDGEHSLLGKSVAMTEVFELIERSAPTLAPILITGESGTGKELVAKTIHGLSTRSQGPFLALNCSAFHEELLASELFGHMKGSFTGAHRDKKGLFEVATEGTLFLDELGEMPLSMQAKLLRVLQDGTYTPVGGTEEKKSQTRILAATNRDLPAMVAAGLFREDLLYRIQVIHIHIPPLRERSGDIEALIDILAQKFHSQYGQRALSPEALRLLVSYRWPGNVRELENELERALILSGSEPVLRPSHFSSKLFEQVVSEQASGQTVQGEEELFEKLARLYEGRNLSEALSAFERVILARALLRCSGNKSQVAKELDISRSNVIAKAKVYGLSELDEDAP